jgi:Ca2+-binding EF-hand superfamily protein
MSELLDRKLRHFFTLMNRDQSDTLELNDYLTSADNVSNSFGIAAGSAAHEGMRQEFTRFWENIIKPMDTDGDGHVNFDEYLTAYTAGVLDDPQGYESIRPIADAIIGIADIRSDGKITPDNFTLAMSAAYGIPEPECVAAFTALDKDTNGYLTRDELQNAAAQYFLGTDPDLPGNALFGRF